jgi:hypothetical protein
MVLDSKQAEAKARRSYERGRVRHALVLSSPLLALVALVAWLEPRPTFVLGIGASLFVSGAVLLWRGRQLGTGALAGVLAGLVPLAFGLCVRAYQAWCHDGMFMPGCVAACAVGGIVAGAWIAHVTARRPSGSVAFVVSAAGVALLTGALGCSCVGPVGIAGMLVGLLVPLSRVMFRQART